MEGREALTSGDAGSALEGVLEDRRLRRATAVLLVLVAAALRAWGAFDYPAYADDEPFHVPSALNLARFGVQLTSNWTHPPVGALILGRTIALFGDNPLGWRIGGVIFGAASVGLLYLLTLRLTRSPMAALLAAALLGFDPFHVYFSRTTFMEIPVVSFFLLFLWAMHRFHEEPSPWALPLAGLAMGLTAATKSYFLVSTVLVTAVVLEARRRRHGLDGDLLLHVACWLVLLPAAVYVASYRHFFGAGHTLGEFLQMQGDALWTLRTLTRDALVNPWLVEAGGRPWEWFIKPIAIGARFDAGDGASRYLIQFNNFPLRPIALAALVYLAVRGVRERRLALLLPPLLFASVAWLFLALDRPVMCYSALLGLPFAYVALAWAVALLERDLPGLRHLGLGLLAAVVAWGGYLYPLASGKVVSDSCYRAVLPHAKLDEAPR